MESCEGNILYEVPVNCVIQAYSSCSQGHITMSSVCLWFCIEGESADLNLYLVLEIIYWNEALDYNLGGLIQNVQK